jgi:ATP phosphoribosyltransferase
MADAIFDLVSTGRTLAENNLKEVLVVLESQAMLFKSNRVLTDEKMRIFNVLRKKIEEVKQGVKS